MRGRHQRLEVVLGPELVVQRVQVLRPVPAGKGGAAISSRLSALARHDAPVVRLAVSEVALDVLDDGGDPDGVEAHAGDVVEVVLNRLPRPAAVLPVRRIARRAGVVL